MREITDPTERRLAVLQEYYNEVTKNEITFAEWIVDRVLDLQDRIGQTEQIRTLLRYVFYQRLPLGNKVEEYIPQEMAKEVYAILEAKRDPFLKG